MFFAVTLDSLQIYICCNKCSSGIIRLQGLGCHTKPVKLVHWLGGNTYVSHYQLDASDVCMHTSLRSLASACQSVSSTAL